MKRIASAIFILLIVLSLRFYLYFSSKHTYHEGERVKLEYTLLDEPKKASWYQSFMVNGLLIQTPKYPELHYGDSVTIQGKVERLSLDQNQKNFSPSTGSGSKHKDVNNTKTILIVRNADIKLLKDHENAFLSFAKFIRNKSEANFKRALGKDEAGLLLGIVLGEKQSISSEFYKKLIAVGVVHVVVASGTNVALVGGFLMGLFGMVLHRRVAIVFALCGIAFYAIVSGFNPPIVRATIMGAVVLIAQLTGRQSRGGWSLLVAALIMLGIWPDLVFDIGFQLSFASTLGILYCKVVLDKFISKFGLLAIIKEDLTTTLAAQIATLPILLSAFGTYSLTSIVVNLLILWTIPFLMLLGGVAVLMGLVVPLLSSLILFVAYPILLYFKIIVDYFQPFVVPVNFQISSVFVSIGYYCILLATIMYATKSKNY